MQGLRSCRVIIISGQSPATSRKGISRRRRRCDHLHPGRLDGSMTEKKVPAHTQRGGRRMERKIKDRKPRAETRRAESTGCDQAAPGVSIAARKSVVQFRVVLTASLWAHPRRRDADFSEDPHAVSAVWRRRHIPAAPKRRAADRSLTGALLTQHPIFFAHHQWRWIRTARPGIELARRRSSAGWASTPLRHALWPDRLQPARVTRGVMHDRDARCILSRLLMRATPKAEAS